MINIEQTTEFQTWVEKLRDTSAQAILLRRVKRFAQGNPGDAKSVGDGVSELRIHFGPGYRVYFTRRNDTLVILLCGGDKSTQQGRYAKAKRLAAQEGETNAFEVD